MPYCHEFKNQIAQWEKELEQARVLLGEYLESGEEEKAENLNDKLKKIHNEQKEWQQDYQERVKELLRKWYPSEKRNKDKLLSSLNFDQMGRLIINGDLDVRGSYVDFCPSLIKTIRGNVDFQYSKTQSLPGLQTIGGMVYFKNSSIKFSEDFQKIIPKLREIGQCNGISVYLSRDQRELEQWLKQMKQKGEIIIVGDIVRDVEG